MRADVLAWAQSESTSKIISKETLNHPALVELVTGLDVFRDTPEAYRRAYAALGIDVINRVPLRPAPASTPAGMTRAHPTKPYIYGHLGVYDTAMRHSYPCRTPEEVWDLDVEALRYDDLVTPVPHPVTREDILKREAAIGNIGLYYPMLYTTLFMWGVEVLGWEIFLMAAALDADRFHQTFLLPCVKKSRKLVTELARASDSPFIFVHDDLADARGPLFRPDWYDTYVFPHYPEIFSGAKGCGKKIIFVADGNMTAFLPQLVDAGVDGLMFETPATPLEAVTEHFGQPGRYFIGGIATGILTFGSPAEIREMVLRLAVQAEDYPGFAMASGGGLHDNIPMQNLTAYFDARAEVGATPLDWRTRYR